MKSQRNANSLQLLIAEFATLYLHINLFNNLFIYTLKFSVDIFKRKIIKRVLKHSFIYSEEDLANLSLKELRDIQKNLLIDIIVRRKFKNRNF